MSRTYFEMLKTTKNEAFGCHIGFSMAYVTPTTNMMRKMDSPCQKQSEMNVYLIDILFTRNMIISWKTRIMIFEFRVSLTQKK